MKQKRHRIGWRHNLGMIEIQQDLGASHATSQTRFRAMFIRVVAWASCWSLDQTRRTVPLSYPPVNNDPDQPESTLDLAFFAEVFSRRTVDVVQQAQCFRKKRSHLDHPPTLGHQVRPDCILRDADSPNRSTNPKANNEERRRICIAQLHQSHKRKNHGFFRFFFNERC